MAEQLARAQKLPELLRDPPRTSPAASAERSTGERHPPGTCAAAGLQARKRARKTDLATGEEVKRCNRRAGSAGAARLITPPGDKSISHRAAMFNAMGERPRRPDFQHGADWAVCAALKPPPPGRVSWTLVGPHDNSRRGTQRPRMSRCRAGLPARSGAPSGSWPRLLLKQPFPLRPHGRCFVALAARRGRLSRAEQDGRALNGREAIKRPR